MDIKTMDNKTLTYLLTPILLAFIVWNGCLTYNQEQLSLKILTLQSKVSDLEAKRLISLKAQQTSSPSTMLDRKLEFKVVNELRLHRSKRDASPKRDVPENNGNSNRRKEKKNKKNTNKKVSGAHFTAYVDEDRFNRQLAEGIRPAVGNFTEDGFDPNGRIYNIWKPEDWNNKQIFSYNPESGKVQVRESGLYLIYGQMFFHGASARKSYGIHINDETVPFIESLSYNQLPSSYSAYTTSVLEVDPYSSSNTTQTQQTPHRRRHERSPSASYSQCNTMAVNYLQKDDEVFLKSLEHDRSVIPKKYLTFWGLAKL